MRVKNTSSVPVPLACGRVLARGEFAPADLLTDADQHRLDHQHLTIVPDPDNGKAKKPAATKPAADKPKTGETH